MFWSHTSFYEYSCGTNIQFSWQTCDFFNDYNHDNYRYIIKLWLKLNENQKIRSFHLTVGEYIVGRKIEKALPIYLKRFCWWCNTKTCLYMDIETNRNACTDWNRNGDKCTKSIIEIRENVIACDSSRSDAV